MAFLTRRNGGWVVRRVCIALLMVAVATFGFWFVPKQQLREIGWTKATELAKVARKEGERFESATWVHKAQVLPKEEFKREVERHLTGNETEAWEIIYFKLYKSQLPVVEQALEAAGLMLGSDKSRGYCLEMICADFLAGANLEEDRT
jgi:hypothetical protein